MAEVTFAGIKKTYANGFTAVHSLDLEVADGELLVVVGPSGCGKTTTLRMLAGLEDITRGEITIGGRVVNELTPKERDIAMVFQSYALYPHLSVADNLGYPLLMAGLSKQDRRDRVVQVAKQLQLDELLDNKPRQLSGGQRQRVAMGRAMVREPSVFLMDEPLSNLDAKLRVVMRGEVSELQQALGTTMFYVTHDQTEAMTLGHRVAIMDRGILQQVAPPEELYSNPGNLFVAGFIGSPPMNLIRCSVEAIGNDVFTCKSGTVEWTQAGPGAGSTESRAPLAAAAGSSIVIGVRPEVVVLSSEQTGAGTPTLRGDVRLVESLGSETIVHIEVDGLDHHVADVEVAQDAGTRTVRLLAKLHDQQVPALGESVSIGLPTGRLHVFDATSGAALSA